MITKLKKDQRVVRRYIRKANKDLYEDVFKNRFVIQQINRLDFKYPDLMFRPLYRESMYLIKIVDNEDGRTFEKWYDVYEILRGPFCGGDSLAKDLNDFIVESDFWKKWKSLEYRKTHWYSGKQLEEMVKFGGNKWKEPFVNEK